MTVRTDRIEAAVIGCIRVLGPAGIDAVWSRSLYPHRSSDNPCAVAKVVRGPWQKPADMHESDEPTRVVWTLGAVRSGARVGVSFTGADWTIDTISTDITEARDALIAVFNTDAGIEYLPGVTVTAVGADSIEFDADGVPGLLFTPARIGSAASIEVTAAIPCEVSTAIARVVVELQTYANGGGSDALSILAGINGAMGMSRAAELRHRLGVTYHGCEEPVDLTAVSGADWESRASTRWQMTVRDYTAHPIDTIETVGAELVAFDGETPIEIPVEFTAE